MQLVGIDHTGELTACSLPAMGDFKKIGALGENDITRAACSLQEEVVIKAGGAILMSGEHDDAAPA